MYLARPAAAAASSHARFSFGIREGQPAGECCRCRMGTATQTVRQARGGRVETRRVSRQTLLSCDCERGRAGREKRGREADALHLAQLVVARGASCGDGGRILYRRGPGATRAGAFRRDHPGRAAGVRLPWPPRPRTYVLPLPSPGVFLCARPPPHPHTPAATCRQPRPHRCHRRPPRARFC